MRIVVTGGAGYIGSVICRQLVLAGHEVTVVDNLTTGKLSAIPAGVDIRVGDIGNQAVLDYVLPGKDAVFHFAASIDVAQSMRDPVNYFQNNVNKSVLLLEGMIRHGVKKIVFSSTAAVYGAPEYLPVTEVHPLRPLNAYGESKKMVEQVLHWVGQRNGLRYACLRYFNAAGGGPKPTATNLVPIVLEAALGIRPYVEIFGTDYPTRDGTAIRDYIHVEDLASAHLLALDALVYHKSLVYNLGTGRGFTVREVIDAAVKLTRRPIRVIETGRRDGDPMEVTASSDLIKRELGWKPKVSSLEEILESSWSLTVDQEISPT